jgi:hypothetical protein
MSEYRSPALCLPFQLGLQDMLLAQHEPIEFLFRLSLARCSSARVVLELAAVALL